MRSSNYSEAYVWVWLPDQTEPVVAGRFFADGNELLFNYGQSYLTRPDALPLYLPELPLHPGALPLPEGMHMPSALRDAAPDAWGRRVILNKKFGKRGDQLAGLDLSELVFLLESGSDRIGALDFQASPTHYVPRSPKNAGLDELLQAAELVEKGVPLTPELELALRHGTAIGGARPKAMIEDSHRKFIAKFSASADLYSVVKAEFVAMRLASLAGLNVAPVSLVHAAGKDVLLVERFDRTATVAGWTRKPIVSALTILGMDEMLARYASYTDLATIVRSRFTDPKATLREVFSRMVFNILCGNTDDHARNHAAFWDGHQLTLTPAYDICPQARTGQEASQAMLIHGNDNLSRLSTCLSVVEAFHLNTDDALAIIRAQMQAIRAHWLAVCADAGLSQVDQNLLWGRQFLNPFAFTELDGEARSLRPLANDIRGFV